MKNTIIMAVAALLLIGYGPAIADGHLNSATSKADLYWFDNPMGPPTGESRITRTSNMIIVLVEPENLVPGEAHTIWFVVFNNPEACVTVLARDDDGNPTETEPGPCDDDDFFFQGLVDAEIAVGNATGNVAKGDGTAEFGGRLVRNMNLPGHQILFGSGFFGDYLLTAHPDDAEVHIIVQTHGQARGGPKLLEQLTYVESNCTPDCVDIQFAVHAP